MKKIYTKLVSFLLWHFVHIFGFRTRIIWTGGEKYLLRFYIKKVGKYPGVYLHHFFMSDQDRDLHNHPWFNAKSLILCGAYSEERLLSDKKYISKKEYHAGMINKIEFTDFHRVELLEGPVWTLFMARKTFQTWGFWDMENKKFIPWNEYVDSHGNFITDINGNLSELYD